MAVLSWASTNQRGGLRQRGKTAGIGDHLREIGEIQVSSPTGDHGWSASPPEGGRGERGLSVGAAEAGLRAREETRATKMKMSRKRQSLRGSVESTAQGGKDGNGDRYALFFFLRIVGGCRMIVGTDEEEEGRRGGEKVYSKLGRPERDRATQV